MSLEIKQAVDVARSQGQAELSVFVGYYYGIFDIEEVFILLGVVPLLCLTTDPAQVRRRYGLHSAG